MASKTTPGTWLRPSTAALLVSTIPVVTECSEGDNHVRATLGLGSNWVHWHAMPWGYVWAPDEVSVDAGRIAAMLGVAVLTLAVFFAFEHVRVGRGAVIGAGLPWTLAWIGTVFPFPFLFFGFLSWMALVPMVVIGALVSFFVARRNERGPPPTPP
jgi:hypothetical protein